MGDSSGMPADSRGGKHPGGLTRRSVTRGVAWTAPLAIVAVAAPAFAASAREVPPCVVQTNFDNLRPGTTPSVLTFLPSTITATISYASTGNGGDSTPGGTGQVASTTTTPPWNYIEVEMLSQLTAGDTVTVTITFSAAITNLSFRIHDIDKTAEGWDDYVIVTTGGYTFVRGTDVIGNGTASGTTTNTGPFRNSHTGDQAIDSGLNHVDLTWAGPLTQIQFIYKAGMTGNSANQHIGIGNLSFSDCVANPNGLAASAEKLALSRGAFTAGQPRACVPGRDN